MPKPEEGDFIVPSSFDSFKQDLQAMQEREPGSRSTRKAIQELLPLLKGCRDRGHSWQQITELAQKYFPNLTVSTLRKIAYELDPSLKGTVKGVSSTQAASSAVPEFEEEEAEEATEDEVWPPVDEEDDQEDEDEDEEETSEPEITITSGRRSKG